MVSLNLFPILKIFQKKSISENPPQFPELENSEKRRHRKVVAGVTTNVKSDKRIQIEDKELKTTVSYLITDNLSLSYHLQEDVESVCFNSKKNTAITRISPFETEENLTKLECLTRCAKWESTVTQRITVFVAGPLTVQLPRIQCPLPRVRCILNPWSFRRRRSEVRDIVCIGNCQKPRWDALECSFRRISSIQKAKMILRKKKRRGYWYSDENSWYQGFQFPTIPASRRKRRPRRRVAATSFPATA